MLPAEATIDAGTPAVPVAENETGVSVPLDAVSVLAPAVVPRVYDPSVAIP